MTNNNDGPDDFSTISPSHSTPGSRKINMESTNMDDNTDNTGCEHARIPIGLVSQTEGVPSHETLLVDGKQCYGHDNCALGHIPNSTACRAEMNESSGS